MKGKNEKSVALRSRIQGQNTAACYSKYYLWAKKRSRYQIFTRGQGAVTFKNGKPPPQHLYYRIHRTQRRHDHWEKVIMIHERKEGTDTIWADTTSEGDNIFISLPEVNGLSICASKRTPEQHTQLPKQR